MSGQYNARCSLVVEAVAHLAVYLEGIVEVHAAKGEAVVDQQVAVGDVQRTQRRGESFSKRLAHGKIERSVRRQIIGRRISVLEAGTVVHISGQVCRSRQLDVKADVQRVPLVVIERKVVGPRRKIRKA